MRMFLAVDLPDETKRLLASQIDPLRKMYPEFTWVEPKNFHITVHFIGDSGKAEAIAERLRQILYDQSAFHLYAQGLDLFVKNRITVYASFRREKSLENMVDKIRNDAGAQNETKFIPHLTVARYRLPSKQQYFVIKKRLEKIAVDVDFEVDRVVLFESLLNGERPYYEKLSEIELQKT